ncbi:hypothetical protein D3C75_1337520 [compost metagenome]
MLGTLLLNDLRWCLGHEALIRQLLVNTQHLVVQMLKLLLQSGNLLSDIEQTR